MIPTILDTLLRWFPRLVRWRYRLQLIRNSGAELNRRVDVEGQLLDSATGKRPLPDAAECRRLALQLGVPSDFNRLERGQVPPKAPPAQRDEHEAFPGDIASGSTSEATADPLNTRLPCAITIGATTLKKGVTLRTLVIKAQMLDDIVKDLDPVTICLPRGRGQQIAALRDFAESCLSPERNGYAVPAHVRDDARRALGIPASETTGDRRHATT